VEKASMRPFNPEYDLQEARRFWRLASLFEAPDMVELYQRFSMLASLSEQRACLLQDLDKFWNDAHSNAEAVREFMDWSLARTQQNIRDKHH
jgi:hypothetical protein